MTRARWALAVLAFALVLAGCGSGAHRNEKSKTRPDELFATAPAGYRYQPADPKIRERVSGPLISNPTIDRDDVAVRQVVREGGKSPLAIAVIVDDHAAGRPGDVLRGFDKRAKELGGTEPARITVAGTEATTVRINGVEIAAAGKNGYLVESIAPDARTAKLVLARLIFAARGAER